jgi:hypothetical protein
MRSLGTRRVAQAAGAAMVAVIALAGCSAGQVAETAILQTAVSGLNTQTADGTLLVRNLQVIYNNPAGYPGQGTAPIEVSLFNQTQQPMDVTITSTSKPGSVSAGQIFVGPVAAGSASASPSAAPVTPAKFTIAPLASETFLPGDKELLQASGLSGPLAPGGTLALSIKVSGATTQTLDVLAPFAIPDAPASRAPGVENENSEE